MRFEGSSQYVATDDLKLAVNAAMTLKRPLLIKGEPGTGKTMLAEEVAAALGMPLLQWHIKSTTKAQQGLYEYDAVSRLRDSQLGDERVKDIRNYIVKGVLWQAFESDEQTVAADRRDRQGRHRIPERPAARARPHGVHVLRDARADPREAASARHHHVEQRKELPDAFLRRCFFHYIKFPDPATMQQIVECVPPASRRTCWPRPCGELLRTAQRGGAEEEAVHVELLDWLKLLLAEDIPPEALRSSDRSRSSAPLAGALLKNEQDVSLFERLAFS